MKKLTKRVNAGGLWFDVPSDVKWITVGESGIVHAFDVSEKPFISNVLGRWHSENQRFRYECMIEIVDLEGADWRECCWFVGDQCGDDNSERREWMERGVDALKNIASEYTDTDCIMGRYGISYEDAELRANGAQELAGEIAAYAAKIRSGEVDL